MKTRATLIKYSVLAVVLISILFIARGRCQDEDEDDEDTYDEEIGDDSTTTSRTRSSTATPTPLAAGVQNNSLTNGSTTIRSDVEATTRSSVPVPTPASAPAPTRATVRTTTLSEYEDDEVTEEEGYGYIFRPLNTLIDNIVAGNVTGIVDAGLSIRTPPEIRAFVNNVMSNVFGAGIGTALKQFMPHLFSTMAPPTVSSNTRDPIPPSPPIQQTVYIQQPIPQQPVLQHPIPQQQPIPQIAEATVITARNSTDEAKSTKTQQPLQLSFAHPGAPASRLRCEVIQ